MLGGGHDTYKVNARQVGFGSSCSRVKKFTLLTLVLTLLCTAILGCAFLLPKNTQPITAHAAGVVDVTPTIAYDNTKTKMHNIAGGMNNVTPADLPYSSMTGSSNMYVQAGANSPFGFRNLGSTIDLDAAFVVFSMNVTVPAGGKITVQYKFDMNIGKATDGTDSGSHFAAELFHFGTCDAAGNNPVNVASLSFATSSTSAAYSALRLDGSFPTTVYSCPQYGGLVSATHKNTQMYPSLGSAVSGCDPVGTGSYTTNEITYVNDTNTNKVYKEFFGYSGIASSAQGCCHIFWTDLNISTEKAEFEKTAKPTASGVTSRDYDGTAKTFNLSGLNSKVALVKATKTKLDGTDTTLYEYTNWPATPKTETGTNPISGTNQCSFTDAGKYTLSFRPLGAVWTGTLDSTAVDIEFYVLPKKVNKPAVAAGDVSGKTYNGSAQTYTLSMTGGITAANWSQYINIDTAQGGDLPTGVTDNSNGSFTITDAGDYDVYLTLADPANTCWNDSSFTTTDWSGPAGGTHLISLKMNPYEITVSSLTCDQIISGNWAWNMGDTATVTLTVSDFLLSSDTDDTDPDKVNLIYYYCVGTSTAENPVTAETETYDATAKTISATIKLPTTLAQGTYTFGVKPDENSGAGKNYTVSATLSKKNFTVSAKGFDPSVLEWTYTVDNVADTTLRLADGDKLKYIINSSNSATVYNPQIMLITDTYDHSSKIGIGAAGYTGAVNVSAVSATYATTVTLIVTDNDTKFINPNSNTNITISADGKTATVKLNWQIEKGDFDLTGLEWEYWYKDANGTVQTGDYTDALEYNDNRWIYVRIKESSLPAGLTFNSNYTTVMSGYDTYGDRQKNVSTYTTNFQVNDFDYDATSFNAPNGTASTLTLNWEIEPKTIVAKFKLTKRNVTNLNYSGSYYIRELDLDAMGVPASYASYFELKYYDSTNTEVTLATIDADYDPTNEKTYTVKAFMDGNVTAANNYKIEDASGNTPTATFKTGSSNSPAGVTIDGNDGKDPQSPIKVTFDGNPQFGSSIIEVKAEDGTVLTANDYDIVYYTGGTPVAANALPAGTQPADAGTYCVEIVLKNGAENIYILVDEYLTVEIEKQKVTVTVDGYDGSAPVELTYDKNIHFDNVSLVGEDGASLTNFTVTYYKGTSPVAGNEISGAPTDAGDYCAVVELTGGAEDNYELSQDTFVLKIGKVILDVPKISGLTFTGNAFTLDGMVADGKITGYDAALMTLTFSGAAQVRNAGDYNAIIKLTDDAAKNYEFASTVVSAGYSFAGYSFAVDSATERTVPFTVEKAVLKADWDKSGETPVLKSLDKYKDVAEVEAVIKAYSDKNSDTPITEMSKGSTYYFEATLTGPDADNFIFEDTGSTVSSRLEYKLPQSGASAFLGKVMGFVKGNWLWFVIALAVLIFLIILIVIIAKRRKNKEAREEKKAKKEEEKERREEEKRRREEEREAAKQKQKAELEAEREKQKHELELAKARQEAELAKIKAQAMAGAGMAATAAAAQQQAAPVQQPQYAQAQQPMPQPTAQPYYAPQGGDLNAVMAKLETEFAKLRAEQAMSAYQQHPQYSQYPQYPQYPSVSAQNGAGGLDIGTYMLMRLESDMQQLRSERGNNNGQPVYMPLQSALAATQPPVAALPQPAQQPAQNDTAAITAAAVAAAVAAVTAQQKPEKEVRTVETETTKSVTVDTPTAYPPDAVVTTTTTVDTTKKAPQTATRSLKRDEGKMFDIDGFYDAFDGK